MIDRNQFMYTRKIWWTQEGSTPQHWEQILPSKDEMHAAVENVYSSNAYAAIKKYAAGTFLLDAGCGPMLWRDIIGRENYVGLDYSFNLLKRGASFYDTTSLAVMGDVRSLPLASNQFDTYLSLGILEHFQEGMDTSLRECVRLLKPCGIALISVPHFNVFRVAAIPFELFSEIMLKIAKTLKPSIKEATEKKFYQYGYSISEIRQIFKAEGLNIIEIIGYDHEYTLTRDYSLLRKIKRKYPIAFKKFNEFLLFINPLFSSHMVLIIAQKDGILS